MTIDIRSRYRAEQVRATDTEINTALETGHGMSTPLFDAVVADHAALVDTLEQVLAALDGYPPRLLPDGRYEDTDHTRLWEAVHAALPKETPCPTMRPAYEADAPTGE